MEDALIERLCQGDEAAFECLLLRHYPQVYRVLYHLVGNCEEAEDLAKETFWRCMIAGNRDGRVVGGLLCRVCLKWGYRANSRLNELLCVASRTEIPTATLPIRVDLPESCSHLDQQS